MPRPLGHPGRSTPVIEPGWAATHRPIVEGTFGATISIRRPGGTPGVFDPVTGTTATTPFEAHYTGSARVQVLPALEQTRVAADQELTTVGYRLSVAYDADIEPVTGGVVNCLVDITAVDENGQPSLVGVTLTVRSIERGSLAFERDLLCTDDLG